MTAHTEEDMKQRNTLPLLVGVQIQTATKEISVVVPQEDGTQSASRSSYTTLGHILKGHFMLSQRHLFNHVVVALFIIARDRKQRRYPSTEEWIKKM